MKLKGINTLVIGAGKSGIASARFLRSRGAHVLLNDRSDLGCLKSLESEGIILESGERWTDDTATGPQNSLSSGDAVLNRDSGPALFSNKELVVISPGVPAGSGPLAHAISDAELRGIEVISEVELASRFVKAPVIAVTGTNGKSTTTSLIGEILDLGGAKVFTGGNLGIPFTRYAVEGDQAETVILEVSSFQLERIKKFRPWISVLLNISPDHLDRYSSMKEYVEAKKRLFMNQRGGDFAVVNMDDPVIAGLTDQINESVSIIPFGTNRVYPGGIYLDNSVIVSDIEGRKVEIDIESINPDGIHVTENVMAAVAVSLLCGVPEKIICGAVKGFHGLPHRMEFIGESCNIKFYNDSKATNVGALIKNLENVNKKVVLIAGGRDKGGSYGPLKKFVDHKVSGLVLIGEASEKIRTVLGDLTKTVLASTMEEAVNCAWSLAESGDIILLSPACSSFDMFGSYVERGNAFKDGVRRLIAEAERSGREVVNA